MYKKILILLVAAIGILQVRCATVNTESSIDAGSTRLAYASTRSSPSTGTNETPVSVLASNKRFTRENVNPKNDEDVSSSAQNLTDNDNSLYGKGVPCTRNDRNGLCVNYKDCRSQPLTIDGIDINGSGVSETPEYCLTDPIFVEQRTGCGWRNPKGIGYKPANSESTSEYGEFPWMVAILIIEKRDDKVDSQSISVYRGGGSLIHPSVVLTAAHIAAKHEIIVRAGDWDSQTKSETYPHQNRKVSSREIHEEYDKKNLYFDVALLFLEKPFYLAPNVGVACLPTALEMAQPGTRCFASGWGKDKFGKEGKYQVILKKVEVPLVEHEDCQNRLRTTRLSKRFKLHSTFICAGGEIGKDTCKGDGGSPLVCPTEVEDRYVQYGMVAWAIGCFDGTPSVYVNVPLHRAWIDDKVKSKGYDTSTYSNH